MTGIELTEHHQDSDEIEMSPERFADINIKALELVLRSEDSGQAAVYIREIQSDTDKVSQYVAGLLIATHQQQAFAEAVARILESDGKTA